MANINDQYAGQINLLAEGLKRQIKLVLFLGAGAPRGAGLPLADELKDTVLKALIDIAVPPNVQEGTLEDLMQTLQSSFGNQGYELIADRVRNYKTLPPSYEVIRNLIAEGHVEAVITTNFDLFFELMSANKGVCLYSMFDDESFAGNVPSGSTIVAQLHGKASDPTTMKGSWTDVDQSLPAQRSEVLKGLVSNHLTVFVGYAARDKDILPVLQEVAELPARNPIWWINPSSEPTAEIGEVLDWFASRMNYLPIDSDQFFGALEDALAPVSHPFGEGPARARDLIRRLHTGDASREFLSDQERLLIRQAQEREFSTRVEDLCSSLLDRYYDKENRTVLHQKASRTRQFSDLNLGPFSSTVEFLGHDQVIYHCVKVPTPTGGSLELALQPIPAGKD